MSSQHASCEEDRKKERTEWYRQGGLLGNLSERHTFHIKVFCQPPAFCWPEGWVQPVLFSDTPFSSISFQDIQAQWFVLEMLSFVSLAFISVGCLSCFTSFLSRRQSQHLTLGVLFNTPLLLDEAGETLINKPTQVQGLPRVCFCHPLQLKERWSEWSFCLESWPSNKLQQGGARGESACVCVKHPPLSKLFQICSLS